MIEDFKVELVEIAQILKTKFTGSERIFFNFFARILCDRFCVRGDTRIVCDVSVSTHGCHTPWGTELAIAEFEVRP